MLIHCSPLSSSFSSTSSSSSVASLRVSSRTRSRNFHRPLHPRKLLPKNNSVLSLGPKNTRRRISKTVVSSSSETSAEVNEVEKEETKWYEFFTNEYKVGSLSGLVTKDSVTFRPEIKYFRYESQWYVIPKKYQHLPESEVNRRMKIKIRNTGRVPWNLGQKHSPEWIANIQTQTAKAMQRKEVRKNYQRRMRVHLAMHRATVDKIKVQQEKKKKPIIPEDPEEKRKRVNERRRLRRKELAAQRNKENETKPQKKPSRPRGEKKPMSEEKKRKISEAVRKKWLDPNYRYRVSETLRLRNAANSSLTAIRRQEKKERTEQTMKECREKYNELMETVARLIVETDSLDIQKCIVPSDTELTVEIEDAVKTARHTIEKIKSTVVKVEEELNIDPITNEQKHSD
eukprot:g8591.t1